MTRRPMTTPTAAMATGVWPFMACRVSPLPYNSFMQFFQTPDHVAIYSEAFGRWRIVPIDDRQHGTLKQWMGNARGRWEGGTLVVETTNFSNYLQQASAGRNIRSLVEKFTRVSPGIIRYDYTLDNPVKWVSPWTSSITFRKTDHPVYEVACHEGNYAIVNILRGGGRSRVPQTSWSSSRERSALIANPFCQSRRKERNAMSHGQQYGVAALVVAMALTQSRFEELKRLVPTE